MYFCWLDIFVGCFEQKIQTPVEPKEFIFHIYIYILTCDVTTWLGTCITPLLFNNGT